MLRIVLAATAVAILAIGCSPEEPFIDSYDDTWRLLAASKTGSMTLIAMPTGTVVSTDVLTTAFGETADAASMHRFRDDVFVLAADESQIYVMTADSLRRKAVINTGSAGPASSIAFANATTAFVTHPASNVVSVIDLTTYTLADTIPVPGRPIDIAIIGNQGCVVSQRTGEVRLFDTRTFALSDPQRVTEAPTYVEADPANGAFVIVSLGAGKVDAAVESVPVMSFVDLSSRSIAATVNLTPRAGQGAERLPNGLTLTDEGFAYVPLDDLIIRVPLRSRSRATLVTEGSYSCMTAIPTRTEVALSSGTAPEISVFDGFLESRRLTVTAPFITRSMLALTP